MDEFKPEDELKPDASDRRPRALVSRLPQPKYRFRASAS